MRKIALAVCTLCTLFVCGIAEASTSPLVNLWGHIRLVGKLQLSGNVHTYPVPTISLVSSGSPGATSAKVTWKTNVLANSEIVYGPTSAYGSATSTAALVGTHSMTIFGLAAGSTYHYAVVSADALGRASTSTDKTFTTVSWPAIGFNAGGQGYYFNNFTFLSNADLAYMQSQGVSTIRTSVCWEELQPTLNEALNSTYLSALEAFMSNAATYDIKVIVDVHGYGRYQSTGALDGSSNLIGNPANCLANSTGYLIGSSQVPVSAFSYFWGLMATALVNQPGLGGYELMNEPHDMGNLTIWPTAAEASIGSIRAVDATTSIYLDGNQWATDVNWSTQNPNFPLNNADDTHIFYTAHAYFDFGGGGHYPLPYNAYASFASEAVAQLTPFATWLQQNSVNGAITEFGAPYNDPQWILVMKNAMTYLKSNNILGIVHYYDTHQSGYASYWPIQDGSGAQYLNAAPINLDGTLNATGTNPLMTLVSQFDLGR